MSDADATPAKTGPGRFRILSAIGERLGTKLRHRMTRRHVAMPNFFEHRRRLPPDPALWVWVAVALMALVPLAEHAVAARLVRAERGAVPAHSTLEAPGPIVPSSPGAGLPQSPSASAPRSPRDAGTATL